jgi:N utilization substance protein A
MSKEVLLVAEAVSNEKGVDKELIFEALEAALAMATKKRYDGEVDVRVAVDRKSGEYQSFRRWLVLSDESEVENPDAELRESEAKERFPDQSFELGDYLEEEVEAADFGRIAAQTAKQVIVQKVREAERALVVDAYKDRVGELVTGQVKRVERGHVFIDLGSGVEALIHRDQLIPREAVRTGDRLRGYLFDVHSEPRGPQLFVTRTAPEFLIELFKIEVPEIGDGSIQVMGAARDSGLRAKIAVRSLDQRIDPVGACVGMRGARVQAVSNELSGERIDIIVWDENPAQFVIHAMSPAEVVSIVIDEDEQSMDVAVLEDHLSQAIGRGGQNVKLASELTGWRLNVMTAEEAEMKNLAETTELKEMFIEQLNIDDEVASILVDVGFSSVEEVAYVPISELRDIEEFDDDIVQELRNRARNALLSMAIAREVEKSSAEPAEDLLNLDGMDPETAQILAANGIVTREDLAEMGTPDLLEIKELEMEEARAAELIMAARAHWFENSE